MTSFYLPSESKIGVGWVAHRLANELSRRGHSVTMFSPCRPTIDAEYLHQQIPLAPRFRLGRWAAACRRLDLNGFDALLAHGEDHLMHRHGPGAHIRTLHGSCFDEAWHATGWHDRLRMAYIAITELASAARWPAAVGVSHNSIRWYPWLNRVIPNGVDANRFKPDGAAREAEPTILFVGTYGRRKRGSLLVEQFEAQIRPRVPDAKLWMVCSDAPASPGVEVLGSISDLELAERYRRAWVFCLPSTYEGFGVPYVEALVSGTPVVATANRGALEVLRNGGGLISSDDLVGDTLVRVLTDSSLRQRLTDEAIAVAPRYAQAEVAAAYERLILEMVSRGPRGLCA